MEPLLPKNRRGQGGFAALRLSPAAQADTLSAQRITGDTINSMFHHLSVWSLQPVYTTCSSSIYCLHYVLQYTLQYILCLHYILQYTLQYILFTVHTLYTVVYTLFTLRTLIYTVVYTVYSILQYTVVYTLFTLRTLVYNVVYTVFTTHSSIHSIIQFNSIQKNFICPQGAIAAALQRTGPYVLFTLRTLVYTVVYTLFTLRTLHCSIYCLQYTLVYTVVYTLFTLRTQAYIVVYKQFTVHTLVITVVYALFTVHTLINTVVYTLFTVHTLVYTVVCKLFTLHTILCSIQYSVCRQLIPSMRNKLIFYIYKYRYLITNRFDHISNLYIYKIILYI